VEAMLAVDERETGGRFAEIIDRNFERRGIGIVHAGPRLKPKRRGRLPSRRVVVPGDRAAVPRMGYRERYLLSREA
jgi:hypothetical protein